MRIGIDCDDVCCDFQASYVRLLYRIFGRPPVGTKPIDWAGSNLQLNKEETDRSWAEVAKVHNFWLELSPLDSFDNETRDYLQRVVNDHDVYFVTNRFATPGLSPMKQTKAWFWYNAGIESPNVMIAKDKGPMASVLELDAFIDDRPKNCIDVKLARPTAKVFIADSSHNQPYQEEWCKENNIAGRVPDLKTFLKMIVKEEL